MAIHGFPGGVISATAPTVSPTSASGVWTLDDQLQNSANWPTTNVTLSNSVRLRGSASAYMTRTFPTAGNRRTWTWSGWVKRGVLSSVQYLFHTYDGSASTRASIRFDANNFLEFDTGGDSGNGRVNTAQVFRDPSAWYHIVCVLDTTQATAANRQRIYVNGVLATLTTDATVDQNFQGQVNLAQAHELCGLGGSQTFDGYLTEINFIDGQALTPNYFGATNASTGAWQPATYRGTYGTNGFYLPMNQTVESYTVEYLVIAGGGGGGNGVAGTGSSGGGGAGGYRSSIAGETSGGGGALEPVLAVNIGSAYTVTIGAGGGAWASGSNSVFGSITSVGGGYGGKGGDTNGANGGSGGGGSTYGGIGGSGTANQGFAGGTNSAPTVPGSGGGGAGGVGANNTSGVIYGNGANGGSSKSSSATGSSVARAGGGGGGGYGGTNDYGSGGSGGGGGAGNGGGNGGSSASANTGSGGGGGGGGNNVSSNGGSGGSGIVIVRYLGSQRGTGGTVTSSGGYTIHTFTSSGTFTA